MKFADYDEMYFWQQVVLSSIRAGHSSHVEAYPEWADVLILARRQRGPVQQWRQRIEDEREYDIATGRVGFPMPSREPSSGKLPGSDD